MEDDREENCISIKKLYSSTEKTTKFVTII